MVNINPPVGLPRKIIGKTQPSKPQDEVNLPKPGERTEEWRQKIEDFTRNLPKFKPDETLRNDEISKPNKEPNDFFA